MKKLLIYIWCLPQNLVALILKKFVKIESQFKIGNATFYRSNLKCGSISLGNYIFLCEGHWGNETVAQHEFGHHKQSLLLGWLYLLVIALPSLIWAGCFKWYRRKYNVSYYSFYTEKWANNLVGIKEI